MTKLRLIYNYLVLLLFTLFTFGVMSAQDYDFEEDGMGMIVMEAENYSGMVQVGTIGSGTESLWDTASSPADYSGEGGMKAVNPGDNHGTIEVAKTNAGYLKYNINFTNTGTYYIWARASKTGGSDDSFHAILAQGDAITSEAPFINFGLLVGYVNGTWGWVYASGSGDNIVSASITVPVAGIYNFRIYIRERDFRIDKIVLSRNPGYVPEGKGPDETLRISGLENLKTEQPKLMHIFPNPTGSAATISYKLDKPEFINIKVYNVLGEEVTTLVDELQNVGKHELIWNTADLTHAQLNEGVCFVKIIAGSETETVKIIISR